MTRLARLLSTVAVSALVLATAARADASVKEKARAPSKANAALTKPDAKGAAAPVVKVAANGAGGITGKVTLKGKAPELKPLNMKSDPFCAKKTANDETVLTDGKGGLANVVVRIAKGVKTELAAQPDVVLDQDGCVYKPRVSFVVAGQTVLIKNSDQTLHNVHTYKGPATLFNQAQPQGFPPLKKKFPKPGDVVKFKCDVHPWMTGYVFVTDSPFAAVSGADGSFAIKDVPPGKFTVETWHEQLGTQTFEVEVKDGKPADLKVEYAAK
jgi:plastocyanin